MERRSTLCQLGFCKIYIIWGECQWRFSRSRAWKSDKKLPFRIWAAAARASRTGSGQQLPFVQSLSHGALSYRREARPRQSVSELMSCSGVAFWRSASLPCASSWQYMDDGDV
jgi:hypothetical protein